MIILLGVIVVFSSVLGGFIMAGGLEEHVLNPQNSSIFKRYPSFIKNPMAVQFLCDGLRPIIDGKIKPDQLRQLLSLELERMEEENHAPVNVLTRAADAMPGFGIVAAVLGIVITMASINGPIELIGEKVAAALVGTFLGIFLGYGFMGPLAVNIEFIGLAQVAYADFVTAMMALFLVLWLTAQDSKIKEAIEHSFRNPFSAPTKESVGIIPNKDVQAQYQEKGKYDSPWRCGNPDQPARHCPVENQTGQPTPSQAGLLKSCP